MLRIGIGLYISESDSSAFRYPDAGYRELQTDGGWRGQEPDVGVGISVFFLALGGVLAFGVTDRLSGIDLTAVGYVLMAAGAIGLVVVLTFARQRSHTSHVSVQERRHIDE